MVESLPLDYGACVTRVRRYSLKCWQRGTRTVTVFAVVAASFPERAGAWIYPEHRDIMAEAMVRCENAGYSVILTVHDELICERHPVLGDVAEFMHLVSEVPAWAAGLPVAAEGWAEDRYHK